MPKPRESMKVYPQKTAPTNGRSKSFHRLTKTIRLATIVIFHSRFEQQKQTFCRVILQPQRVEMIHTHFYTHPRPAGREEYHLKDIRFGLLTVIHQRDVGPGSVHMHVTRPVGVQDAGERHAVIGLLRCQAWPNDKNGAMKDQWVSGQDSHPDHSMASTSIALKESIHFQHQ